jgi:haloalkane dehalogenase
MKVLRTPEDRFADLPDFGYPPRYAEQDGLRLVYVEAGPAGGEPVLPIRSEPRTSIGPVASPASSGSGAPGSTFVM